MRMKNRSSETGNVLFYILIGIVLFAALGFAMSRINRGGATADPELNRLQASEILQYARGLNTAAQAMQIDGVTDDKISFENAGIYVNAGCAADTCKLFSPSGGNMSYIRPDTKWLDSAQSGGSGFGDWVFSGNNAVSGVGTDAADPAAVELLAILPWVRKDLCIQLNKMIGMTNPADVPPRTGADVDLTHKFTGTYTPTDIIGGAAEITGQRSGCVEGGGNPAHGTYHFYKVLLAR
jgi:hypothetical protein